MLMGLKSNKSEVHGQERPNEIYKDSYHVFLTSISTYTQAYLGKYILNAVFIMLFPYFLL